MNTAALHKHRRPRSAGGAAFRGAPGAAFLLAAGLVLTGCAVTRGPSTPTSTATLAPGAFSTLDEAGVQQIEASKTARLDMRSGTLEKTAVKLSETADYGPEINTTGAGKIDLTIAAPEGEITAKTDRIRFNTVDTQTDFSEVTYFLTADSNEEFYGLIRDGVQRYGIDRDSAEDWIASTENDPSGRSSFSITSGHATGLTVNYDLRYDGSKDTQVIIVHVLPAA